jgi:putative aminopeptidase FrvX
MLRASERDEGIVSLWPKIDSPSSSSASIADVVERMLRAVSEEMQADELEGKVIEIGSGPIRGFEAGDGAVAVVN